MKKNHSIKYRLALAILLGASSLGILTACSDKEETEVFASKELTLNMTLTPTVVDLPARKASQEITITSNTAWGAVSDVTWAKLSASSGTANGTVTITLEDNTSTEARKAVITFSYGNTQEKVTITQEAVTATLSATEVTLGAKSSSQDIKVTSNSTWSTSTEASWIHIEDGAGDSNGRFTVTLDDNKSLTSRQGSITFTYGSGKQTISVNQEGATATKFEKVQANNVGRYQADISGIFNSVFDITEYGVVYSATVEEPTIDEENANIHQEVISTTPVSQDIVSATIKGLKAGSKNYARIYTKGPLGTEYSPVVSFVTSGGSPSSDDNPTPGY